MIVETLAVASIVKTFHSVNKALTVDEKALKKYAKAFEQGEEAELLIKKKAENTDKRLANVAKKKRAIIQNTVPRFVEVYGKIQKIEINNNRALNEISIKNNLQKLATLNHMSSSVKKGFTDKELVCGLMTKGVGKMIQLESEQYLSAANNQMRVSNVMYEQAESIGEVYDAISCRADRIAKLLMSMNALFVKSINETEKTIEKNGLNVRNYNDYDKGVLMTCVNVAIGMSDIIDIPVVDADGHLCNSALEMLQTGEEYLKKMNQFI